MIWLRMDVDNPSYSRVLKYLRLQSKLPIPNYHAPTRDTLTLLKSKYPKFERRWFIRSIILPPKDILTSEEVGVHFTNPADAMNEYSEVAAWAQRPIKYYTRHGFAPIASGKIWTPEEKAHVSRALPNLVDLTDQHHFTITRLPDRPDRLDYSNIEHILFHPCHFHTARTELEAVLEQIQLSARK